MSIRGEILNTARELTDGDRNEQYGDPYLEYERLGKVWGARLGITIAPHQAALMMADLKANRLWFNPGHEDSPVDGAAYFAIAGECGQRMSPIARMTACQVAPK